jgi:hypothetical protein
MSNVRERVDRHEKQIAVIRDLLREGTRLVVKLAAAQKRTETNLQTLIKSLERGAGNGNSKQKVDLQ